MNTLDSENYILQKDISIKDVAREADVSVSTVSKAMNNSGYVSKHSRVKVMEAIEKLHYKPSNIARCMVTRRSGFIGIMMPHLDSSFLTGFIDGLESAAGEKGFGLMLCYSNDCKEKEEYYLNLMAERRVEGMIVMPAGLSDAHFTNYFKRIPILFAVRTFDDTIISSIVSDDYKYSYRVMEHIINKGHKKIAIIRGPEGISTGDRRFRGAFDALKNAHIEPDPELIRFSDFTAKGARLATLKLLEESTKPTVIYAISYVLCIGVCLALKEKGLLIPSDISVASYDGFDDSLDENLLVPAITANTHPGIEMGKKAFELLFDQIEARKQDLYKPETIQYIVTAGFADRGSVIDIIE
ncbi:MAG: LacI family DNA-binding transcriptional regulator [Christensenellales bacterium]